MGECEIEVERGGETSVCVCVILVKKILLMLKTLVNIKIRNMKAWEE